MTFMQVKLQAATVEDVESIAALRNAISDDLTFKHGRGPWTVYSTTSAVLADLRNGRLLVALHRGEVVASLKLSITKPASVDLGYFSKVARPWYLSALAVSPELQRQGIGRACLDQAFVLARREKADAIFLEAFDHPTAGAGPFFAKCGYRETGRNTYRGRPLIYYETLLGKNGASVRSRGRKEII
jgi:ribosomal protein S18 acetylase RimI-like enzyme